MLLTLNARRMPSQPSRRAALRIVAVAAAVLAGAAASLLVRHAAAPQLTASNEQPGWAGTIGTGISDPVTIPLRETSASYTSPVALQAASDAAGRGAKSCGVDGLCSSTSRQTKALIPPRRPVEAIVATTPEPSVVAAAAPPAAKPKTIFSASGLMERIPSANVLLKPFSVVGNTMSGLIKHF